MSQKPKVLILAGPQSSGKTTIFTYLQEKYPHYNYLPEINPYQYAPKGAPLSASVKNTYIQQQVVAADLERMSQLKFDNSWNIVETGIFSLAYAEKLNGEQLADSLYQKYEDIYSTLLPRILFIDTPPQVSWERRKQDYMQRLRHEANKNNIAQRMEEYKKRIDAMYPLWIKYYKKVPYTKYMVTSANLSVDILCSQVDILLKKHVFLVE